MSKNNVSLKVSKEQLSIIIEALILLESSPRGDEIYDEKDISVYGIAESLDVIYTNNKEES